MNSNPSFALSFPKAEDLGYATVSQYYTYMGRNEIVEAAFCSIPSGGGGGQYWRYC